MVNGYDEIRGIGLEDEAVLSATVEQYSEACITIAEQMVQGWDDDTGNDTTLRELKTKVSITARDTSQLA